MTENEAIEVLNEIVDEIAEDDGICYVTDCNKEPLEMAIQALEENQQYHAIGTVEDLQALKEKAEPKKPISIDEWSEYWKCPTCGKLAVDNFGCKFKFCRECGTKLDWS